MPNCDFYAAGTDHKTILEFLLSPIECDIYELYSRVGQSLRQFQSLTDFEEHFAISNWAEGANETIRLNVYPHGAKGKLLKRRIQLDPKRCHGATFRYRADGWGLVQLYLEHPHNGRLRDSHTNHNSPKRAAAWARTFHEMGDPGKWDWERVTAFSRRLNRFIRSLAVSNKGSRVILPFAAECAKSGIVIW